MKYTLLLLLPFMFVACATNTVERPYQLEVPLSSPYQALTWNKSDRKLLLELEKLVVPRVLIEDTYPLDAFALLGNIPAGWLSPALVGRDNNLNIRGDVSRSAGEHFFRRPVKSISGENLSYAQIIDRICVQSGLAWVVDDSGVVVTPVNDPIP